MIQSMTIFEKKKRGHNQTTILIQNSGKLDTHQKIEPTL